MSWLSNLKTLWNENGQKRCRQIVIRKNGHQINAGNLPPNIPKKEGPGACPACPLLLQIPVLFTFVVVVLFSEINSEVKFSDSLWGAVELLTHCWTCFVKTFLSKGIISSYPRSPSLLCQYCLMYFVVFICTYILYLLIMNT